MSSYKLANIGDVSNFVVEEVYEDINVLARIKTIDYSGGLFLFSFSVYTLSD